MLSSEKGNGKNYDESSWNDWKRLPLGLAAIGSAVLSLGLLVPSIDQVSFLLRDFFSDFSFKVLTSLSYLPDMVHRSNS